MLIQINTHIVVMVLDLIDGSVGKNVIIFGADMSPSVHIDNKGKDILILGKEPIKGLDGTIFTAEAKYASNFTKSKQKICIRSINGSNSLLFANATKVYQFKTKNTETKDYTPCLSNF